MGYGFTHLGADVEELIESSISAPGGGEGRGEVGEPGSVVSAWPTVAAATGPLPLPPQAGGEGEIARRQRCQWRCVNAVALDGTGLGGGIIAIDVINKIV
jgi:hypothetical protein